MNNPLPHLPTTRREFLRMGGAGLGLMAFSAYAPRFLTQAAAANVPVPGKDQRILVLVQLGGGNDGLNTVVPFTDHAYFNLRPRLALKDPKTMFKLNDALALAPPCRDMAELYNTGKLAVVQNVGYPNPNRSHFRSTEIWETASDADAFLADGWVGRYLDNCCSGAPAATAAAGKTVSSAAKPSTAAPPAPAPNSGDPAAVYSSTTLPQAFFSKTPQEYFSVSGNVRAAPPARPRIDGAPAKPLLEELVQATSENDTANFLSHTYMDALVNENRVQKVLDAYRTNVQYPEGALAQSLRRVAALVAGNLETRVYFCTQTGYDTHSNQFNQHQRLLGELSAALAAFQKDLEAHGLDKQVLTMTFSEFGRRPGENDAGGTDHGTAAPLFVMSGALKSGGVIGKAPNLNIAPRGDLEYGIDFRQVYATVLDRWLDADPTKILGKKFPELAFL